MDELNFIDSSNISIDLNKIWNNAKNIVSTQVSGVSYDVWINTLEPIDLKDTTLVLATTSTSSQNVLNKKYKTMITAACNKVYSPITSVEFVIANQLDNDTSNVSDSNSTSDEKTTEKEQALSSSCFNPKYTFDNFVVGPSNQFVAAAALAVAESPGDTFNPLYIWGNVGLGKTHLLHAIGNHITENNKKLNVIYVTTEKFTNDVVSAIQNSKRGSNATTQLRQTYRNCDVLIIDDIQGIAGRTSTQEEFFNTFNDLMLKNKQIVLSSDKMPKDINPLEERLRSRFGSGLIADIGVPEIETRIAILNKKAQLERYNITKEAVEYIAEVSKTHVRDLESCLSRAVFYSKVIGESITSLETTREALKDMVLEDESTIDTNRVIDCVCKFYSLKKDELLARKRTKEVALARQIAMYLISDLIPMPLEAIGNIFGKDHSTVVYAKNKVSEEIKKSKKLAIEINDMRQMIKGK